MREVIEQFGSSVTATVVTVIIIGILTGISIFGVTGLVGVAGYGTAELTKDGEMQESTASKLLTKQEEKDMPNVYVKTNPEINKPITVYDLFEYNDGTIISINEVDKEDLTEHTNTLITFKEAGLYKLKTRVTENNKTSTMNYTVRVIGE
ncbi:MAG: hypothetical protein E7279_05135 [Lachnospiraceae bacterium]|nr:hypothetical protein [Lachnospiraceae bacterium]